MSESKARWMFSLNQEYPLHSAATTGNWQLLLHLLKEGYRLTDRDENGNSPLHCAAAEGRLEIVQYVTNHRNSLLLLNLLNDKGLTPLAVACAEGQLDCAKKLLETKRCRVNHKNEQSSALHEAVASDNVDCVELLIRNRCLVNKKSVYGETPLHVALRALRLSRVPDALTLESVECIKLLVATGKANVNATFYQSTPLHYAAAAQCEDLVRFLLHFGASTRIRNSHGCKAIDFIDDDHPLHNVMREAEEQESWDDNRYVTCDMDSNDSSDY